MADRIAAFAAEPTTARARRVATASAGPRRPAGRRPSPEAGALSPREAGGPRAVAHGDINAEIAASLGISVNTVERHVSNVYRKIDARGRADATAWALRRGLA